MEDKTLFYFNSHEFFLFGLFTGLSLLPFFSPFIVGYLHFALDLSLTVSALLGLLIFILAHLPYFYLSRGSAYQVGGAMIIGFLFCASFFYAWKDNFYWIGAHFIGAVVFYIYVSVLAALKEKSGQKK